MELEFSFTIVLFLKLKFISEDTRPDLFILYVITFLRKLSEFIFAYKSTILP